MGRPQIQTGAQGDASYMEPSRNCMDYAELQPEDLQWLLTIPAW